jgi:serine/threonine protein kinase/tetratricopeptide (TPR) repeat protein
MATSRIHVGPYRLIEPLGQGGMGVVYRAEHRKTRQEVALKTVRLPDRRHLEGLQREIHALGRLRHPGVVRLLDEDLADDPPWYAMELVHGQTLRRHREQLLRRQATEPLSDPRSSVREIRRPPAGSLPWWTESLTRGASQEREPAEPPPAGLGKATGSRKLRGAAGAVAEFEPVDPVEPEALLRLLSVVRRLCDVLFYLHGEGLVHRDLKPENVLVTGRRQEAGGRREAQEAAPADARCLRPPAFPVLVDFGLLGQWPLARLGPRDGGEAAPEPDGRERLDLDVPAGTAHYMAPEQIRGHLTDARADLYALGCILYELLTGQPPFPRLTVAEVLAAHQFEAPRPPSQLCPGLAEGLDRLVLDLLEKEPRRRPGSAGAVAARLARLGAENGFGAEGPPPRLYLYRPGFSGRGEELSGLRETLDGLARGRGTVVLVGGQSGIGKTRLALEFAREARRSHGLVLAGKCLDVAGRPLEALLPPLQAIAEHCRRAGPDETRQILGGRAALLATYEPGLRELAGLEEEAEPAQLPPQDARRRLLGGLLDLFQAVAQRRPTVLILDDLQWADEILLGFLDALLETDRLDRCALLALGTYRTEECPERVARLLRSRRCISMDLGLLSEADAAGIAAEMLGLEHLPQGLGARLARHAAGNPLALAETVRTLVELGVIQLDAEGSWRLPAAGEDEAVRLDEVLSVLPPTLQGLLGRRLADLAEAARTVAEAAAVVGREMSAGLLAAVSGIRGAELFSAIDDLLRRQLFEEPEPGRLRFVHDKLREVTEEQVDARQRRRLHRAAAEAIEALDENARRRHLGDLGRHWEAVGEKERARDCYLAAARQELTRASLEEAIRHAEGARRLGGGVEALLLLSEARHLLALPEAALAAAEEALRSAEADAAQRHRAQLLRTRIHERRDAYADSLAAAEALLLEKPPLLVRLEATIWKGRALWRLGRLPEAEQTLAAARQELRRQVDCGSGPDVRATLALCLTNLGIVYLSVNRYEEALAAQIEAIELRRQLGDPYGLAGNLNSVGCIRLYKGDLDGAQQAFREALGIWRRIGGLTGEAAVLINLGSVCNVRGRFSQAREAYDRAIALSADLGDRYAFRSAVFNRGTTLHHLGDLNGAQQACAEAERLATESGEQSLLAKCWMELGSIASERGDVDLAIENYQRSAEEFTKLGYRTGVSGALARLGNVYLRLGDYERSAGLFEQALEGLVGPQFRHDRAEVLRDRGLLLRARGRYREALADLEEALDAARDVEAFKTLVPTLAAVGAVHATCGRLVEARDALAAAIALARDADGVSVLCEVLRLMGWLHLIEGRPEEARSLLEESLSIASTRGLLWREARARSALSRARIEDSPPLAQREAEQAAALWRKLGNPLEAGAALGTLGRLQACEGRIGPAFETLAEALGPVSATADPNLYLQLLEDEAAIRLKAGDVQGARRAADEARGLARSLGAEGLLLSLDRLVPPKA